MKSGPDSATSNATPGVWHGWHFDISPGARKVWTETVDRLLGVKYTAVAYATQVTDGINYAFLAKSQAISASTSEPIGLVLISTYVPSTNAQPRITGIRQINP